MNRADEPRISVVMPVYNALPYLDEAIESILRQSFEQFEFVIVDDASTDGSTARLRAWAAKDRRIRLVELKDNLGPAASSEYASREARAPFVARMDADDVSHPDRLAEQLQVLTTNPDVGVVGCLSDGIDSKGQPVRGPDLWRLVRRSTAVPFAHGAMMYRRELFERVGGYRLAAEYWEDQDLVSRMADASRIVAIPRPLYRVRQTATSTRALVDQDKLETATDLAYRSILGLGPRRDKVDPSVFIALGSVTLWSGGRPRLFRRCLRRASLGLNWRSFAALLWTAWAAAGPGSLRTFLRGILAIRNLLARSWLRGNEPVAWKRPATQVVS